jgi:hypothetical protein
MSVSLDKRPVLDVETQQLRREIRPGWRVKIIDHDYLNDGRDDVTVETVHPDGSLTLRPRRPWSSQGREFTTMRFTWSGDIVTAGRTVDLYHTPSPHTGKSRRRIKSFIFKPGRTESFPYAWMLGSNDPDSLQSYFAVTMPR